MLGLLSVVAASPADPRNGRLAGVALALILLRAVFASSGLRSSLGAFGDPLDLLGGLGLALGVLWLTGGTRSEIYVVLLLDVVLAWVFLGPGAGRFLALASSAGVALLAMLGPAGGEPWPAAALSLGLRVSWPLLLLVALEAGARQGRGVEEGGSDLTPLPRPSAAAIPLPEAERDGLQEILHDLRSPLTVMRLYTELMAERAQKGEPPLPEELENLQAEIGLMESVLDADGETRADLRPRPRPRERFDLVKLISTLAGTYRLAHSGKLRLEFLAESPELTVAADPMAVQRALRNVLDNAVKYTPAGGQVRIRAGASQDNAIVVVSDTGLGMTAAEQRRAFEIAFRGAAAHRSGAGGSGIGLGLSRELLEANGGRISLSSEPGRGSDVTILLPLASTA